MKPEQERKPRGRKEPRVGGMHFGRKRSKCKEQNVGLCVYWNMVSQEPKGEKKLDSWREIVPNDARPPGDAKPS
jgi:hypothetical protein